MDVPRVHFIWMLFFYNARVCWCKHQVVFIFRYTHLAHIVKLNKKADQIDGCQLINNAVYIICYVAVNIHRGYRDIIFILTYNNSITMYKNAEYFTFSSFHPACDAKIDKKKVNPEIWSSSYAYYFSSIIFSVFGYFMYYIREATSMGAMYVYAYRLHL